MLRRIRFIMIKEFIQVWRDRRLRIFLFLPPLIQLIIYGYATNFDIKNVPTAIYDEDHSAESQALISHFGASEYFSLRRYLNSENELRQLIDRGEITLALRIPAEFAAQLKAGRTATLQLIIDATDSNAALIVAKYASSILHDYSQEILQQRFHSLGHQREMGLPVIIESRAWFNPNLISRLAFVPGVIAVVVMLVSLMLTAMAVVREKELGTLEQILVTPIKPLEFMLGKTVPFVLIALIDVVLVSLFAIFWFDLPFRGSSLVLLLGTLAFLFNSVGLGLLISTVSSTQQQALMAGTFLTDTGYSPFRSDFPNCQYAQAFSVYYLCESFTIFYYSSAEYFSQGCWTSQLMAGDGDDDCNGVGDVGSQCLPLPSPSLRLWRKQN